MSETPQVTADDLGSNLGPPVQPEEKQAAPASRKKAAKGMPERTWILLEDNDDIPPTGLFLGHNGNGFLLVPGEPAHVPNHIIEILDHAIITVPVVDRTSKRVIGHRQRTRFPYRRVDAPENTE